MLVPLSWLKDYVDIDVTPQELEEKLFSCGFEVDELIEKSYKEREIIKLTATGEPVKKTD